MAQPIEIEIFGRTYQVRAGKDPEYTRKLAQFVDEQMRRVAEHAPPASSPVHVAVLTLLHVANELFDARGEADESESSLEEKARELVELLETTLAEAS